MTNRARNATPATLPTTPPITCFCCGVSTIPPAALLPLLPLLPLLSVAGGPLDGSAAMVNVASAPLIDERDVGVRVGWTEVESE